MAEFISTFTTGFQKLVEKNLPQQVKGIKILTVYDGMVHYKFDGNSRDLEKIIYFNNTFFVLKFFNGQNNNFKFMVNSVCSGKSYYLISKGSFRIRFNQENQFTKVDKNISKRAEDAVLRNSKLTVDRVNPSTEIWYCIRREGFGFCGQLISKREFTEKNLNKGELRPEVAYFMNVFAEVKQDDVVGDFFAGYGSIPVQLVKNFNFSKLYVNDLSKEQYDFLKNRKQLQNEKVIVSCGDAFDLAQIEDNSVDKVITDPPWGYYEDIGDISDFYGKMFISFNRILKPEGRIVILSARKEELENSAVKAGYQIKDSIHTLVNGKKAGLYLLEK